MGRVLVVGSGIAGLVAAREAARSHDVALVTKGELGLSNTRFAQGGIAAVMFAEDDVDAHVADTLAAGAGLCDPAAVRVLCTEGPDRIRDLIAAGVAFDTEHGRLARGLEAAHSYPRVLHAGGDATGARIEAELVRDVRAAAVAVREHTFLVDLLTDGGRVVGARVLTAEGETQDLAADAVVLASGGAGRLYPYTSNPPAATGDGVACAARAGAALADLELYQFHPTTLAREGNFLVSEAVRGEGAVLRDASGARFMTAVHPDAELAPRDVVARAVAAQMAAQGGRPVVLDATALGADTLARRFPGIDAAVRAAGLDWATEPVPVTPAAHYWMGGVATDLWGRTSMPGLYAAGEAARTGVHGANRLASNSLLEGAVFGHRAARAIADPGLAGPWPVHLAGRPVRPARPSAAAPAVPFTRARLQHLMWDAVGLVRDGATMRAALALLDAWAATLPAPVTTAEHEDANLLLLARAMTRAALARTTSVGAHHRSDSPTPAAPELMEAGAC